MAQANIMNFRGPGKASVKDALRGVWKDFISSVAGIDQGGYQSQAEMRSVLNNNLILMHSLLMSTASYRELVNSSYRRLTRTKYWGWKPVYEDDLGKAGLFSIYRSAEVPLHDHPGTHGVLMVVEGELEVERFTLKEQYRQTNESGMVELDRYDYQTLKPFDITWFGPEEGNLHRMQAISEQCVLLQVHLPKSDSDRSWYFPIFSAKQHQDSIMARRIMSRYL